MDINGYAKKWCQEDYDIRDEGFYAENAYYIVDKAWALGGFKHGIVAFIINVPACLISCNVNPVNAIFWFLIRVAILTLSFYIYGICKYNENDRESAKYLYCFLAAFFAISAKMVPPFAQYIGVIIGWVLYFNLTFIKPFKFFIRFYGFKKKVSQFEQKEAEKAKETYSKWENDFKSYRYGLPKPSEPEPDELMQKARALFEGYTLSDKVLKTRYRQLAKQYHPDAGGDVDLFQSIISCYEEILKTVPVG